jgi:hypothetical protein
MSHQGWKRCRCRSRSGRPRREEPARPRVCGFEGSAGQLKPRSMGSHRPFHPRIRPCQCRTFWGIGPRDEATSSTPRQKATNRRHVNADARPPPADFAKRQAQPPDHRRDRPQRHSRSRHFLRSHQTAAAPRREPRRTKSPGGDATFCESGELSATSDSARSFRDVRSAARSGDKHSVNTVGQSRNGVPSERFGTTVRPATRRNRWPP